MTVTLFQLAQKYNSEPNICSFNIQKVFLWKEMGQILGKESGEKPWVMNRTLSQRRVPVQPVRNTLMREHFSFKFRLWRSAKKFITDGRLLSECIQSRCLQPLRSVTFSFHRILWVRGQRCVPGGQYLFSRLWEIADFWESHSTACSLSSLLSGGAWGRYNNPLNNQFDASNPINKKQV